MPHISPELQALKTALRLFANDHAHDSVAERERQFGALLIQVIQIARVLNIDLLRAGTAALDAKAGRLPRLVFSSDLPSAQRKHRGR